MVRTLFMRLASQLRHLGWCQLPVVYVVGVTTHYIGGTMVTIVPHGARSWCMVTTPLSMSSGDTMSLMINQLKLEA